MTWWRMKVAKPSDQVPKSLGERLVAGWSSLVARRAHNPKVVGSNPAPATNYKNRLMAGFFMPAPFISASVEWMSRKAVAAIISSHFLMWLFLMRRSLVWLSFKWLSMVALNE
jgi:hypothetical protein